MSSIICQTFVGNAWRSDLCSNCFKCLEDHTNTVNGKSSTCDRIASTTTTQRYMPQATSLYQSRGISTSLKWRLNEPIYERVARRDFGSQTALKTSHDEPHQSKKGCKSGILIKHSAQQKKQRSRSCVDFASEEALVIGYGGNDYDSDQSPWEMGSDDGSIDIDLLDDTDEDRKITRLTRNNTEFNSSNQNLLSSSPEEKSKNEVEKLNSINNSKNSSQKTQDKARSILTYNDIQSHTRDKQLSHYYFPASIEALKSYLQNGNVRVANVNDTIKTGLTPPKNLKVENDNKNCKPILVNEFTPLNTRTYSFVSELSKNNTISDHSSDSDYSTCRLTPGDSTDSSESFQDAEDVKVIPCPSFLHGKNFSREQPSLNSLDSEKKYDEGSSTSGDISNLSDDSDTSETTFKTSRNVRSAKISQNEKKRSSVDVHVIHEDKDNSPTSVTKTPVQQTENTCSKKQENEAATKGISKQDEMIMSRLSLTEKTQSLTKNEMQSVSISVDRELQSNAKPSHSPAPKPPLDVNLSNIIAVNGCSTSSEQTTLKNKPSIHVNQRVDKEVQRTNSSDVMTEKEKKNISNSYHKVTKPKKEVSFEKEPSDDEDSTTDFEKSPDAINNRQSKLAALALELELARRDSEMRSINANSPLSIPINSPEIKSKPVVLEENFSTIKKGGTVSCASRLNNTLPDVLLETPVKTKKSRFSLKKLLKRNKDSGTFTPTGKEINPKAWKKQTFDRSRLSLEIVHPMDMPSGESTPTEENPYIVSSHPARGIVFKGGYNRARSLSALPQLSSSGEFVEESNCSLLECRKVDTLPARKAGTVAERKKNRPSLVRTPSCSAIPSRPGVATAGHTSSDRTPPPKPPPPPKCKVMHPPPPPPPSTHPRVTRTSSTPVRPPPPQIPETKSRTYVETHRGDVLQQLSVDKEYANLGDIRSQLTPSKPVRPSAPCASPHRVDDSRKEDQEVYETLQPNHEEEDHYTYLDETSQEKKSEITQAKLVDQDSSKINTTITGRPWLDLQTSYAAIAAANYESLAEITTTTLNEGMECFRKSKQPLRWKDFETESNEPQLELIDRRVFSAIFSSKEQEKVTLVVIPRKPSSPQNVRNSSRYPVLASFTDNYVCNNTVYVLPRCRFVTVDQFALASSQEKGNQHIHLRNQCFVLLQLIHSFKNIQAEGIEEIGFDLEYLLLVLTHEDRPPVFVLFPEDKFHLCDSGATKKTLCQAALAMMFHFLNVTTVEDLSACEVNGELLAEPVAHTFRAIAKVLQEEKASSLSQAKGLLEYMLWGPVDLNSQITGHLDEVLGRWLDLQRAQMVKSTISQLQVKQRLQVYEEYQLVFLLQASVKSLKSVISNL